MMDEVQVRRDLAIVRNGRVIWYAEFQMRAGGERKTVELFPAVDGNRFVCMLNRRDGEGRTKVDSLESILTWFHPAVGDKYRRLFSMEKPTEKDIRQAGFGQDLEIVFQ